MGGAPPPPLDFAPQGSKNPEKFDPLGSDFGGARTPRINVQTGGAGGSTTTTPIRRQGGPAGPGPPFSADLEPGPGSRQSGRGLAGDAPELICPGSGRPHRGGDLVGATDVRHVLQTPTL